MIDTVYVPGCRYGQNANPEWCSVGYRSLAPVLARLMFGRRLPGGVEHLDRTEPLDDENAPTGGENVVVAVTGRASCEVGFLHVAPHDDLGDLHHRPVDEPVLSHEL